MALQVIYLEVHQLCLAVVQEDAQRLLVVNEHHLFEGHLSLLGDAEGVLLLDSLDSDRADTLAARKHPFKWG